MSDRCWVVFDLGETLVDETRVWSGWADHLGVPRLPFFAALGAVIAQRRPHSDVFALFRPGFRLDVEVATRAAAGSLWHVEAADLYPDALPVLHELRQRGYRLAVMANQPAAVAGFLSTLPVDAVATSNEWGVSKPDPAFFARVAQTVGAAPRDVAYVGDRVDNDVLPARAAGMLAVHVRRGPWGVVHAAWPEAAQADVRVDGLADLPDALQDRGFSPPPGGARPRR